MLRPFRASPATSREAAADVGRAWADHEAAAPQSLKGKPTDGEFVWSFDEAAAFVSRSAFGWSDLAIAVGEAAHARWSELRAEADGVLAWTVEAES